MAQPDTAQFVNVVTLGLIILPFFATAALDRIDQWNDEGRQGYLKFATIVALSGAYLLTLFIISLVFDIGGQVANGLGLTATYFLFVALYVPTLGLLAHAWMKGMEHWLGEELDNRALLGILFLVGLLFTFLVTFNPV